MDKTLIGPVDVLAVMNDATAWALDVQSSQEMRVARVAVAALIEALEVAQGDLHMLKKAVEARDPWPELLVRATDVERDLRAALARIGDAK